MKRLLTLVLLLGLVACAPKPNTNPPPLAIAPQTVTFTHGVAGAQVVQATGGTPPYSFEIIAGALPEGLTMDPKTGIISGTAKIPGTYSITVAVTDANTP